MPVFHNDALDDPLMFDGMNNFGHGMNNLLKPSLLEPNACEELKNVDVDLALKAVTRRGTEILGSQLSAGQKIDGAFWYDTASISLLVVACNGVLYKWDGVSWTQLTGFSYSGGTKIEFVQLGGTLYVSDGTNAVHKYTGGAGTSTTVNFNDGTNPMNSAIMIAHTERIFATKIAGQPDDLIAASPILYDDTDAWGTSYQFRVGGDGDAITAHYPWQRFIMAVFKRNKVYIVNTDPTVDNPYNNLIPVTAGGWLIDTVSTSAGCVSHRTVTQVGTDLFFLSEDGVRSMARTIKEQEIGVTVPLSDPINPIIARINWEYAHLSAAVFYKNRYILSVPIDASTIPNYVIVYNTLTQRWSGYWTGWNPFVFTITAFNQDRRLVFGNNDGQIEQWLEYQTDDSETLASYLDRGADDIETVIRSREFDFREPINPKTGFQWEAEFVKSKAIISISVIHDGESIKSAYNGATRSGEPIILPETLPFTLSKKARYWVKKDLLKYGQFRGMQLELASRTGKLVAQSITASAFVDTI